MKFKLHNRILLAGFLLGASIPAAYAVDNIWNGSVSADWHNAANWTAAGGVPDTTTEVAVFNGSIAGDQSLTFFDTRVGGDSGFGGIRVDGTQTANVEINNLSAIRWGFRLAASSGITIHEGAGAFSLGTSGNQIQLAPWAVSTFTFQNNSSNTATLGDRITSTEGGGGATFNLAFSGTGNWLVDASINPIGADSVSTLTKSGTGILTLTGFNTYTGGTTISAGTLALNDGNNRLSTAGTVAFSGNSIFDVGSTSQSLSNLTVGDGVSGTVTGAAGSLTLTGSLFRVGSTVGDNTETLNMAGLGTFQYNNAAGSFSVNASPDSGTAASHATVTLATTNTITANVLDVANVSAGTTTAVNTGTLNLGQDNRLYANTINVGTLSSASGTLQFQALNSPELIIRGATGGSSRADMVVGSQSSAAVTNTGTVDFTANITGTSNLNAMIGTLTVGQNLRTTTSNSDSTIATGTFTMGGGTLDATTLIVGRDTAGGDGPADSVTTGTFTFGAEAGIVKVGTLTLGDKRSASTHLDIISNFNLNHGGTLLAQTIQGGENQSAAVVRNFNWNDGTIKNYDAATDLTISSELTLRLAATGTHTFDIDASRTANVSAVLADATTGGTLNKAGAGTVTLNGVNTYSGATTITGGTLALGAVGSIDNSSGVSLGVGNTFDVSAKSGYTVASLTGSGNVLGALTVSTTLSLGNSPGTVSFSDDLLVGSGAIYEYELIGGDNSADLGNVAGDLTLTGAFLDLYQLGAFTGGDKFTLFAYDGTLTGTFVDLADEEEFTDNLGGLWKINYDDTTPGLNGGTDGFNYVTITAIPEPSAVLLGSLGLLAVLRRSRN